MLLEYVDTLKEITTAPPKEYVGKKIVEDRIKVNRKQGGEN